ncbi:SMI1/KNR4 family protein [Streptomyces roseirectus]|uniref:SMI1/KNR4 family protein n=1 Tax=Streptomyces roseirectus TaxID=2768066 RepID=A0A7H0IQZ0_9ACTN|nr:SMI1/KNR4 family protein [Streptomyces roseirectus]QNP75206.1 SMI1/KNR4 family protein [Streptomyces roseirectus]
MNPEAENVRRAWARVTRWLDQHAPHNAAALRGPAHPKEISDAESALGVRFPQELWTWLLTNDGVQMADAARTAPDTAGTAPGGAFLPSGRHLLSVEQIVQVARTRAGHEAMAPSPDPDPLCLTWHPDWIPFAVETDWLYGDFIDTATGRVGSWSDGDLNRFGVHDSLAGYFHALADDLRAHGRTEDGRLTW